MSGRVEALHVLAFTWRDVLPGPKGASTGASSGEVPSDWALCPSCDGAGETLRFHKMVTCFECSGAGRYRVDQMTGRRVGAVDATAPAPSRRVRCDRCHGGGLVPGRYVGETGLVRCPSCDGTGMCSVPLQRDEEPGPGRRLKVGDLRDGGDWDRLEAALELVQPGTRALFIAARVELRPFPPGALRDCDTAVLAVIGDPPLRVPGWAWEAWRQRDQRATVAEAARRARVYGKAGRAGKRARVRELIQMGHSVAEAARLAGCSLRTAQRAAT